MWRVVFESGEAMHVAGATAEHATRWARLLAWSVTGIWLPVVEVTHA